MTPKSDGQQLADTRRWVPGEHFGLEVPADLDALLSGGADFLTRAFRATGALAADNSVRRIVEATELVAGGTGKKALLTVEYERPQSGLPERLFLKFSRNLDNELWDSARHLMASEVKVAVLSTTPDFPVPVPALMFADVDPGSGTGLIVSECIPYGLGDIEPAYAKCLDYLVPDQVAHYRAILTGLAALSGAHRAGKLSPEFDTAFPYDRERAVSTFGRRVPEETVVRRANRMFDFIDGHRQLFPANVRTAEFRRQFLSDIPDVVAAGDRIAEVLHGNPDFIAFAHWNANIDNCWFRRRPDGSLECGFLDWANAAQLSVAQSITGAISGAETFVWDEHLDDLLGVFIDAFAAQGGPLLELAELRLHTLLVGAAALSHSMGAPIALEREIEDVDALTGYRDGPLREHENARIQLHMMTRMLNVWQTRQIGDLVRSL